MIPNTFHAKVGFSGWQVMRGLRYLMQFPLNFGGFLIWLGLPAIELFQRKDGDVPGRRRVLLMLVNVCVAHAAYTMLVGGEGLGMSRFIVPIIAPLCLLVAVGTEGLVRALMGFLHDRSRTSLISAALRVATVATVFSGSIYGMLPRSHRFWAHETRQFAAEGKWIRQNTPANAVIATHMAGAKAYYSERRVIDMLGLTDRYISHLQISNIGQGRSGHEKRDYEYVLSRKPDYVLEIGSSGPIAELFKANGYRYRELVLEGRPFSFWMRSGDGGQ